MCDKLMEVENVRNTALSQAETYDARATANKEFGVSVLVKKTIDSMQLFNTAIAIKLAERQAELGRTATLGSIYGKVQSQELIKFSEVMKFAKSSKKDSLYD